MNVPHGEPWRWRCPNGHASWVRRHTRPASEQYRCDSCGAVFGSLVDARTLTVRSDESEAEA